MTPKVSVIMPAYNASATIRESIESVQNQLFVNWELIVIDDCSSDGTVEVVKIILKGDERVRLFECKANAGPARARNLGLQLAGGNYVAFLDADDLWSPEKLDKHLEFHQRNPNIKVSHSGYRKFSEEGWIKTSIFEIFYRKGGRMLPTLYYKNTIATLTVFLESCVVREVGYFDITLFGVEDHEYWLRIAESGYEFGYLNDTLASYRVHNSGISRFSGRYKKNFKRFMRMRVERSNQKYKRIICAHGNRFLGYYYLKSNKTLSRMYFIKSICQGYIGPIMFYNLIYLFKTLKK